MYISSHMHTHTSLPPARPMNYWNFYEFLKYISIFALKFHSWIINFSFVMPLWHRLTRTTHNANALHYMSDKAQPHNTKYIFRFSLVFARTKERTTDFSLSHHGKINIIQRFRSIFQFFYPIFFIFHFSFAYCWWNNMKYVKHKINFMIPNLLFLKSHERFLYLSHFLYQLFPIIFNL